MKMNLIVKIIVSLSLLLFFVSPVKGQGTVTDLRSMGYAVFPTPQNTNLTGKRIGIDESWHVVPGQSVPQKITDGFVGRARELHDLNFSGTGTGRIALTIKKDAVAGISDPTRSAQAYKISIGPGKITIVGNDEAGLFYGIQSFLQLLKPVSEGKFRVPSGTITDWPDLELRFIHWDTKHHREKM